LQRLDTLISKIQGTISFNVDKKLKEISRYYYSVQFLPTAVQPWLISGFGRMELVFFPHGKKRTLEEFVLSQEENIRMAVEQIQKDASDISYSLSQVISWLHEFAMESTEGIIINNVLLDEFWNYHNQLFYLAILSSVKGAFNLIKSRLCSKRLGGFFLIEDPFFNVDVELSIPSVSMQPPMKSIQTAINECAYIVLSSFKSLQMLGAANDENESYFYNLIVADRRIIPSILLLTGALEAVDRQVRLNMQL
jgi:dynein heavy chain